MPASSAGSSPSSASTGPGSEPGSDAQGGNPARACRQAFPSHALFTQGSPAIFSSGVEILKTPFSVQPVPGSCLVEL
jgi:hypothetical protein